MRIGFYIETHLHGGLEQMVLDSLSACKSEDKVVFFHNGLQRFENLLKTALRPPDKTISVVLPHTLFIRERNEKLPRFLSKPFYACILISEHMFLSYDAWKLRQALKGWNLDILHIFSGGYPGPTSCLAAAIAAKRVGIPKVVITIVSQPIPRKLPLCESLLDWRVKSSIDLWLPNTHLAAKRLVKLRGMTENNVRVIHGGRGYPSIFESRKQLKDKIRIGTVSVLIPAKGVINLIKVGDILRNYPINIEIAGDGKDAARLKKEINRLGIEDKVALKGHVPDINLFLTNLDIFVFTSSIESEGLPNVLLEAMACKLPIIYTGVGGVDEVIQHGISGLRISPDSPDELAKAVIKLIENPELKNILGTKARAKWELDFTLPAMIKRLEQMYEDIYGSSPNPVSGNTKINIL